MIYIALIIALTFMTITFAINGFTKFVRPGLNQMKKDVLKLRAAARTHASEIIPFKYDEIELLSSRISVGSIGKRFRKTKSGFLNSIYNEPMVIFSIKNYMRGSQRKIIYARTKKDEFVFIDKKGVVQLYLNGNPFGRYDNESLISLTDNKTIAWLEGSPHQNRALKTHKKQLALLNPNIHLNNTASRAFQFVGELNESEQKILMALIIYKLLENE